MGKRCKFGGQIATGKAWTQDKPYREVAATWISSAREEAGTQPLETVRGHEEEIIVKGGRSHCVFSSGRPTDSD